MSKAIFVMIDGLRPDAIAAAGCATLMGLQQRGASTLAARSVMPSVTLPCHMSIFHSVPPTRHGVVTNDWMPMARPLPGLIEQLRYAGKHAAFFHNWEPLRNLSLPGGLTFSYFRKTAKIFPHGDNMTIDAALDYIPAQLPDFAFVYLGTTDEMGHLAGWMSDGYLEQVAYVDGQLGRFLAGLPAEYTVLVQADHGGHDRSHGTEMAEDMTIPWLIAGPEIRQGHRISSPVSLLDTAPTLARVLGVPVHEDWEGRCIEEVFV
ncbi:MAG: alkaline phosphatase family protein [Caldilineaceae bacterium]|nr:alkaline phosphatase family protein [Caldilineaceae bacterium]HRJ44285.1 alkaline phosphatase family protein [Caldilineaceae bacterium]